MPAGFPLRYCSFFAPNVPAKPHVLGMVVTLERVPFAETYPTLGQVSSRYSSGCPQVTCLKNKHVWHKPKLLKLPERHFERNVSQVTG
jgi:hypothetical protein